jgi:hypothetical protein
MNQLIKNIIKPKNGEEQGIVNDEEFLKGVMYGKFRNGHPEGAVIYHIKEVLGNIDKFYADDEDYYNLRLIAILHDTFKHKVDQTKPKQGDNHHGRIAEKFGEKFSHNTKVLRVIKLHDDAYNAWQKGGRHGDWYSAKRRAEMLIKTLVMGDCLDLYLKFYRCDNSTGDKLQDNYDWFIELKKTYK